MINDDSKKSKILAGTDLTLVRDSSDFNMVRGITRRDFVKYSVGTVAGLYLGTLYTGCAGNSGGSQIASYPIDPSGVVTTAQRMITFPMPGMNGAPANPTAPGSGTGLYKTELCQISQYAQFGYGVYTLNGEPLPIVQRTDLMPSGYTNPSPVRLQKFARFFTISDLHITDKESPNQLIYLQQEDAQYGAPSTAVYSPVMMYTTHILDAAIQTINALHNQIPFNFGISLGDTCNSTQYNELRWYMDVIDGKVITPSTGANLGAATIDYQRPYQAAGLNPAIPWYQTMGNHDHFFIGSVPVDANPALGIRNAYLSNQIWAAGDVLAPLPLSTLISTFPCTHDTYAAIEARSFYMGVFDGSTPTGTIKGAGSVTSISTPPTVAADPNRRSLLRTEWIQEYFNTTTSPAGHGFNLVDPSMPSGFTCYSFVPNSAIPLKIIVLDVTQSENDGSHDIHGHGFLDTTRWAWLQAELAAGQASNQLMIIAAHNPLGVATIGSEYEWWESANDPNATMSNAVTLTELVQTLWNTPNLLMWIAGHRHVNTVKGFPSPNAPEQGFWQVETCALKEFPQQFRTFDIYLNSDYSISIVTVNVDPAVAAGTPAATGRSYSIAACQIIQNNAVQNNVNASSIPGLGNIDTMDPSRPQNNQTDPTIKYTTLATVPYCASYNAELFKYLNPNSSMYATLKAMFPAAT
ncbi:MAG: TIGR03768 family metallophosphoesterase [Dissulfurispiraceae bacterium]